MHDHTGWYFGCIGWYVDIRIWRREERDSNYLGSRFYSNSWVLSNMIQLLFDSEKIFFSVMILTKIVFRIQLHIYQRLLRQNINITFLVFITRTGWYLSNHNPKNHNRNRNQFNFKYQSNSVQRTLTQWRYLLMNMILTR